MIAYPHDQLSRFTVRALNDSAAPVDPASFGRPDSLRAVGIVERPQAHARVPGLPLEDALRRPEPPPSWQELHLVNILTAAVVNQRTKSAHSCLRPLPVLVKLEGLYHKRLEFVTMK